MTEPVEIRIARWVREHRGSLGWTVDDLVAVAGVSPAVVYAIESGAGTTRLANVAAVIESLGGNLGVLDGRPSS